MRAYPIAAIESSAERGVMDPTPEQWDRIKALFAEATPLPLSERQAFLERVRRESGDTIANGLAELLKNATLPTQSREQPFVPPLPPHPSHSCTFEEGELVLNRFRIVRFLNAGGMGEVYHAHDQILGPVALKTIRSDLLEDPNAVQRFHREVQLPRRVKHPNVCSIYDLFVVDPDHGRNRVAFLTMELLSGTTLRDRIQQGPIPWAEAEPLIREICQGMAAIHDCGIVHRDFKPGNVMLSPRAVGSRPEKDNALHAIVMDFGLAVESERRIGDPKVTRTGRMPGTLAYMAPEQLRGESTKVSPASDVYALGLVIYEMLAGKRPFAAGDDQSTLTDQATDPASPDARGAPRLRPVCSLHPEVPTYVDRVIAKCLAYEPADRFPSAGEVARAIESGALNKETGDLERPRNGTWPWGSRLLSASLTTLLITGVALTFLWLNRGYTPSPAAQGWYEKGLASFEEGLYLTAKGEFEEALNKDPNFGMARVRLAEALNELDFRGEANKVMARLTGKQEEDLTTGERKYAEAVRATLAQDFAAALALFEKVHGGLPRATRSAGYVDLGRAEEKAGKINEALEAYSQAKQLAPESPAAYLRSAVLESRQGANQKANDDYRRANELFQKLGALEGRAEVAYQRSYWQSILGNYGEARKLAQESLDAARQMTPENVQLEVRARCRFSAISHGEGRDEIAIKEAGQAMELAHQNGLEYWETDARLRQGAAAAYLKEHDLGAAENAVKSALDTATRNQWPRLIALAQFNLAAVRDLRSKDQDLAGLAAAAEYYKTYQFHREYRQLVLLRLRGLIQLALYEEAKKAGLELLEATKKSGSAEDIAQAEELLGSAFLGQQDFSSALQHFDSAAELAQKAQNGLLLSVEQTNRADCLARLGRFDEADGILVHLDNNALGGDPNRTRARLFCLRGLYARSVQLVTELLRSFPGLPPSAAADARIIGATAEARAGKLAQARIWVKEAAELAQKARDGAPDPETVAFLNLAQAEINRLGGSSQAAKLSAEESLSFFHAHSERESEWMSLYEIALAEKGLGSAGAARKAALNSLDILSALEHSWGTSEKGGYEKRPDVVDAVTRLRQLANNH